jgi:hypothetical protein
MNTHLLTDQICLVGSKNRRVRRCTILFKIYSFRFLRHVRVLELPVRVVDAQHRPGGRLGGRQAALRAPPRLRPAEVARLLRPRETKPPGAAPGARPGQHVGPVLGQHLRHKSALPRTALPRRHAGDDQTGTCVTVDFYSSKSEARRTKIKGESRRALFSNGN